jgi:hypothetical protein
MVSVGCEGLCGDYRKLHARGGTAAGAGVMSHLRDMRGRRYG